MQQRNARRAIRIVLNRGHPGRHTQLVALEINQSISALGTTTTVARSDLTLVITPGVFLQTDRQRLLRLCFRNLLESRNRHAATTRRCWPVLSNWHLSTPSLFLKSTPSTLLRATLRVRRCERTMPSMRRLTAPLAG